MKICIPIGENNGTDSLCFEHFGSAPYFCFVDSISGSYEIKDNSKFNHQHGQCNPASSILENGADSIIVTGMGLRALQLLQSAGIEVYQTNKPFTISDVLSNFESLALKKMSSDDICSEHNCS